jgi:hypothetical protein
LTVTPAPSIISSTAMPKLVLAVGVLIALLAPPISAAADVPGKPVCDESVRGCTRCWRPYLRDTPKAAAEMKAFEECREGVKAKGLVLACVTEQLGPGDEHFFCPPGVTMKTVPLGGSCAACTIGAVAPSMLVTAAAGIAALVLLGWRRGSRPDGP